MATLLTKTVRREVNLAGKRQVVSICPSHAAQRFPTFEFRLSGKRHKIVVPIESVLLYAAQRQIDWEKAEKKRLKKLRQQGKA